MAGAKGKYAEWITEEGLIQIEGWARDGLVDKQIAFNIGVTERTFTTWKDKFPSISSALKKGKEVVDRQVENALFKSALGYEYTEVTKKRDVETGKMVITKEVTKYAPPNPTSAIFWLKNRKPGDWRDKQVVEHDGNVTVNNPFTELTTEELRRLANEDSS